MSRILQISSKIGNNSKMKLLSILAASVTSMRVTDPAPGFVNEQGAFFADQSSDQAVLNNPSHHRSNHHILLKHHNLARKMLTVTGRRDANIHEAKAKDGQMNRADGGQTKTDKTMNQNLYQK